MRISCGAGLAVSAFLWAALPAAAATTITTYDRSGFAGLIEPLVKNVEDFEGVSLPCALPTKCVSSTILGVDGVSLSTNGSPLAVTNARNASSGVKSLAANIGTDNYNLAPDQTVTFNFASSVAAFAIDINTFLQGSKVGDVGNFFADVWAEDGTKLGRVISQYSPFAQNSNPNGNALVAQGKIGQFLGFSSGTPFNKVTIGQIDKSTKQPFSLDTLVTGTEPPPPPPPPPPPVPLPAGLPLLAAALGLLAFIRRKFA